MEEHPSTGGGTSCRKMDSTIRTARMIDTIDQNRSCVSFTSHQWLANRSQTLPCAFPLTTNHTTLLTLLTLLRHHLLCWLFPSYGIFFLFPIIPIISK